MGSCIDTNYKGKLQTTLKVTLIALALSGLSFYFQGDIGINLCDEGFLWYGTWRTSLGEVPIRDFQSYDPGRYYWSAAWSKIFGEGIISLRTTLSIFQAIGLTFGLLALYRIIRSWWMLIIAGLLLTVWMIWPCKYFESSIAMASVYFAIFLIENPTIRRHFIAGIFVGTAACFGINLGLYGLASFFLLILFVWFKVERINFTSKISAWSLGILVGYSPMLLMLIVVPNFFELFLERLIRIVQSGSTNLTLPIPWPWLTHYSHMNISRALSVFFTGAFFMIIPVFYFLTGGNCKMV